MNSKKIFLLFVIIFQFFSAKSANYFWIGGTGNWNQTVHWSLASGGATAGALPTAADNVIFDGASGLSAAATVTMNVAVIVVNFDFSAAPAFTLAGALPSIEIRGNLLSNNTATVSYPGAINLFSTSNTSTLTSNGRTWNNNFFLTASSNVNGVSLADNFITTGTFNINRGQFLTTGKNCTVQKFISLTGQTRTIDISNSIVAVSGNQWKVETGALTFTSTGSTINLTNGTAVSFIGGGQTYNILNSSATTLTIEKANTFGATTFLASSAILLDSVLNTFNTLTFAGTCTALGSMNPIFANAPTPQIKINVAFTSSYLTINKVNANAPTVYTLTNSNVTNSTGWTNSTVGSKFYWIGNSGNWTDGSHWSNSSGGLAINCIPNSPDSVFFDANSFSLPNQTVTVNTNGYFKAMKWQNIAQPQTLLLDSVNALNAGNLFANGDVTFHSNLKVRKVEKGCAIEFNQKAKLTANSANIDGNFRVNMAVTDSLYLQGALIMSDTSSFIMMKGKFNTTSQSLTTGTFRTLNDPSGITDTRALTLGSSSVHIVQTFQADNDPQFTLTAGTSNLYVGDTIQLIPDTISYSNGLLTSGLTFYNVTLNFQPVQIGTVFVSQKLTGNNTFNKLKITPKSRVDFQNASTQTVTDTLYFVGSCADSIRILSDGAGQFTINKANTKLKVQCVGMEDCVISSAQTAYFSTNIGNNGANWTFNASSPITANFTSTSPDCYGTTTTFTPTSSTVFSEPVTYQWQYNDGSTVPLTADQYSGSSNANLAYPTSIGIDLNDTLQVASWTELTDPSNLFYPATGNGTGYPSQNGSTVNFNFNAHFALSLENATGANAFLVDMDTSYYKVKNKYRPKILIYKNGAPYTSVFLSSSTYKFQEDTLANGSAIALASGSTTLVDTTVTVSLDVVGLQPTDQLTFYTSVVVTHDGYPTIPRWKNASNTAAADVAIGYKMAYDSLKFIATPLSNNHSGNTHVFEGHGNFNVSLIATNDVNHCIDTATYTVTINGPISSLNSNQLDTIICLGDQVIFSASSTGDTTTQYSFLLNGTVIQGPSLIDTLAITSIVDLDTISVQTVNGGCTSVNDPYIQFAVNQLPTFSLLINPNDTICQGDLLSFAATSLQPGTLFRYKKNASFVTPYSTTGLYSSSSLINADVVTLFVKSPTTGCINDSIIPITVNPLPTITLLENSVDLIICAGTSVSFTASGAGVGGQYEFFINGVSQGVSASATFTTIALTNGSIVSVKGYTSSGCGKLSLTTFTYTVISNPTTAISFNPGSTVCSGSNVNVIGTGATLYQFFVNSVSQGAPSTTSSINSTLYSTGSTFYVIGTTNGCSVTSPTITLTVTAAPTTAIVGPASICAGTNATFTASGATTYQFLVNGVTQGPFSATNTFSSSTLSNGNVVKVIGQSNGCFVSSQMTITVNTVPNVQLFSNDADNVICSIDPITFTGANSNSYELFVNGTSVSISGAPFVNPTLNLGANTLYVIGTALNGCTNQSNTITTTVNATPTMSISSSDLDNIICAGQSVTYTGTGSSQYQFFVNGSPQGSLSPTTTFTTTSLTNGQSVTVLGSTLGCTATSAGITMTVNAVPVMSLTASDPDNSFCLGDNVTFTGLGAGAGTYQFFVNSISQGAPSAVNTINSLGFAVGNFPVSVTGTLAGCSSSSTLNISVNALPIAGLSSNDVDNTICQGSAVTYTATGGNIYQFFINGTSQGSPGALGSFTSSSLVNGDILSVNVINGAGCLASNSYAAVTVNPVPVTNLTSSDIDNQICINDNVVFTGSGASLYEFFVSGVSQGAPSASTTFSTNALTNGQNVLVVGTALGCPDNSNTLTFAVFGPPSVQLLNNGTIDVCVGENTNLLATGATNYEFTVNGIPVGGFTASPTFTSPVNNGDIVSVIGQTNGCNNPSSNVYTFIVNTYPTLSSSSSDADNTICLDDLVTFTATGAATYDFEINGFNVQSGLLGSYNTSSLANGDVVTIIGLNGDCASSPSNYTFVVNSMALDLTVSPSSLICTGETATFTASGASQYEFFLNGATQGALSATNTLSLTTLDQDEITFTGFSSITGCTQVYDDYILMNVAGQPAISNLTSLDICDGDSVILYSNFNVGNQWYLNGSIIPGATDTSYVAYSSGDYSLEITTGGIGSIQSFGYNAFGTFGDGTNFNNPEPTNSVAAVQFDEISSGYQFILGVSTTGTVYSWGDNSSGQLGNGTYTSSNIPIAVPTLSGIKTISTSENSAMAVTNAGSVYVWGNNSVGQLGTGNTSVINFPFLNTNLTNIDTIAGGKEHFVILKNDGTVWTMGSNTFGQLGIGNQIPSMLPVQVSSLSNIVAVGAGEYHSFAINTTGDLYVWGNNGSGQLGLNDLTSRLIPTLSALRNVINAQGGAAHSLFLTNQNKVYSSGSNTHGQLGIGDFVDHLIPVEASISGAVMISAGEYTSLVKRQDNSVFGFGSNIEDQLSSVNGNSINAPEYISELDGVSFIEAGRYTSHVINNEVNACLSGNTTVNVLAVPVVTISAAGGVLSTIAGVSYQWYFNDAIILGANSQNYTPATPAAGGNYNVEVTFANGCTGTSPYYAIGYAGISDLENSFNAFPNPTNGTVTINLSSGISSNETSLFVKDLSGRIIYFIDAIESNNFTIDFSTYAEGIYVVELSSNSEIVGRKNIVKTH